MTMCYETLHGQRSFTKRCYLSEAAARWELPTEPRSIRKFDRYPALKENWTYSIKFLKYLSETLANRMSDNVETIAIAGSFARLEGSSQSDADYILVVKDPQNPSVSRDQDLGSTRSSGRSYRIEKTGREAGEGVALDKDARE